MDDIDFSKGDGLVPAVVQDSGTRRVLMLGYMNRDSLSRTLDTGKVTFFSRSRNRVWTKGEESGNFLYFENLSLDCDRDTLLISARPAGPVCHTGRATCFGQVNNTGVFFLDGLEQVIETRRDYPEEESYTSSFFGVGVEKISRKVGEEAVELILEAVSGDDQRFLEEAGDLLFHFIVLLKVRGLGLPDVCRVLEQRRRETTG